TDRRRRPQPGDAQHGSLLGPAFDPVDIAASLDSQGAVYERYRSEDELLDTVASHVDRGKVIGWFQGRMEDGPRALGCRSIIGAARSPEMQRTMNLKIKYRESFRPFAPCVLRERAHEVFDMRPEDESPYMLMVASVRSELRTELDGEDL